MNEKDLLSDLQQVDSLLARCVNPALTRGDHDALRNVMQVVIQRVSLSYKLEAEMKAQEVDKKPVDDKNEA